MDRETIVAILLAMWFMTMVVLNINVDLGPVR